MLVVHCAVLNLEPEIICIFYNISQFLSAQHLKSGKCSQAEKMVSQIEQVEAADRALRNKRLIAEQGPVNESGDGERGLQSKESLEEEHKQLLEEMKERIKEGHAESEVEIKEDDLQMNDGKFNLEELQKTIRRLKQRLGKQAERSESEDLTDSMNVDIETEEVVISTEQSEYVDEDSMCFEDSGFDHLVIASEEGDEDMESDRERSQADHFIIRTPDGSQIATKSAISDSITRQNTDAPMYGQLVCQGAGVVKVETGITSIIVRRSGKQTTALVHTPESQHLSVYKLTKGGK